MRSTTSVVRQSHKRETTSVELSLKLEVTLLTRLTCASTWPEAGFSTSEFSESVPSDEPAATSLHEGATARRHTWSGCGRLLLRTPLASRAGGAGAGTPSKEAYSTSGRAPMSCSSVSGCSARVCMLPSAVAATKAGPGPQPSLPPTGKKRAATGAPGMVRDKGEAARSMRMSNTRISGSGWYCEGTHT